MNKWIAIVLFVLLAGATPCAAASAQADNPLPYFRSETAAQTHCPADHVVWLNLPTGIYHFKGQRWYGHTRTGAYVCRKDADKMGDRATRNGQ